MHVKIQTLSLKNFYYLLFVDDSSFNTVPQLDLIELIWCKVTARKNKTVPSILMKGLSHLIGLLQCSKLLHVNGAIETMSAFSLASCTVVQDQLSFFKPIFKLKL